MPHFQFRDQTVWITGAASGIGHTIAENFTRLGARVTGFDVQFSANRREPFDCLQLDITNADQVDLIITECLRSHRNGKCNPGPHILINAAGTLRLGQLDALSADDWHHCLNVNASGPFYLLKKLLPHFKQQRRGAIVNIASNAARVPRLQMAAYCASKSALASLSHCAALELAEYGVRCNLVSPGSTDTPMLRSMLNNEEGSHYPGYQRTIKGLPEQYKLGIPLQKIATPQEIANTVLFLASDLASHITMQEIVVDGGATLAP